MMMRKVLVVLLVLGLASAANAALSLKGGPVNDLGIGASASILVNSDATGAYGGWLEISDRAVADWDDKPAFTAGGNPNGDSAMDLVDGWYMFTVVSLNPDKKILAGDHITVMLKGLAQGTTALNLYADDAATLLGTANVTGS